MGRAKEKKGAICIYMQIVAGQGRGGGSVGEPLKIAEVNEPHEQVSDIQLRRLTFSISAFKFLCVIVKSLVRFG